VEKSIQAFSEHRSLIALVLHSPVLSAQTPFLRPRSGDLWGHSRLSDSQWASAEMRGVIFPFREAWREITAATGDDAFVEVPPFGHFKVCKTLGACLGNDAIEHLPVLALHFPEAGEGFFGA
jgi:hypothetical protein